LRNAIDDTAPPEQCTRAPTRPDGTSIVSVVSPSPAAARRPESTAHAASAIVPCPHAVEKPSLCQNRTPRSAPSSSGGTTKQPYMSACPRGSWHSSRRTASTSSLAIARTRRSATESPGRSGAPLTTIRNGSPAVW
jgi:hypothetical protein